MGCGSDGDRQKTQMCKNNNMENASESIDEDVPKILSHELRDVFPIFTNMLDVKSFMKFAMTSKETYNRCMEDKAININVDADGIEVWKRPNGSLNYEWFCFDPLQSTYYLHAIAVHELPRRLNVRVAHIRGNIEATDITDIHSYLKGNRVNNIYELDLEGKFTDWETVFAIIKDFNVKAVRVTRKIEPDILRSILQLNLEKLWYNGRVPEFILYMESAIPEITFMLTEKILSPERIPKEEFLDICSRIQSGSLNRLNINSSSIDWSEFDILPSDSSTSLPDARPLVLKKTSIYEFLRNHEYWILHSHGGITKCVTGDYDTLTMFKCEPRDDPWILRKEEDVLKDFAEKHPTFSCSAIQFRTYFESFEMVDFLRKGPLPKRRPLCCRSTKRRYWLLLEDENLMDCTWKDGVATLNPFNAYGENYKILALHITFVVFTKQIFWRFVEQVKGYDQFELRCKGLEEFDSWFDDVEKLDFEYSGPLPTERPLVFVKDTRFRVVLLDDRLVLCEFSQNRVTVQKCKYFNRPPILFTAESVVEMLKDPNRHGSRNFTISLEEFLIGFKMLTRSRSARHERRLIWEQAKKNDETEDYWYKIDRLVRKVTWKEGRVFIKENDLRDAPPNFMRLVFEYFAKNQTEGANASFTMELLQFNRCLTQFAVVPFDYSGPLTKHLPMAFVKNEFRHTFHKNGICECEGLFIRVWFLWNGKRVTDCSWGRRKSMEVEFGMPTEDVLCYLLPDKSDESHGS